MSTTTFGSLRAALAGTVVAPGDDGWDEARRGWSRGLDQRPAAVVRVASATDVVAAVRFAADAGLPVAVQPRGHGGTRALDGCLLLRTGALDELAVDVDARTARIGAGVPWGRVLAALDGTGLVAPSGSNPSITAVPYLLGGGLSWLSRSFGTGASIVRAADVVDASGTARRVDADTDPDLLWALRGGGGDFAVVTAVEVELPAAPEIYGGRLVLPGELAGAAYRTFAEVTRTAPDAFTVWVTAMSFPPVPQLPEEVRGRSFTFVDAVHLGPAAEAEALLAPFRALGPVLRETLRALRPSDLGTISEEPDEAPTGITAVNVARPVTRVDDALVDVVLRHVGPGAPLTYSQVRHLGGALRRADPARGAGLRVEPEYSLWAMGMARDPEGVREGRGAVDRLDRDVGPWATTGSTLTFHQEGAPLTDVYPADVLGRLQRVKREVDPGGVLRSNHPVLAG
ncbi:MULTISPECIES: FAD-binding oxidoreductase [unclassified Actinotalea]|uniref:FAD-binding oxidoreductase n=1 Tax=unclassified Actinotalea TaxID=2638618 RepID=UPI0015F4B6E0|nr:MULTISPECIES: FAD-binding oxidoreductase [unclassified Actinotalea]